MQKPFSAVTGPLEALGRELTTLLLICAAVIVCGATDVAVRTAGLARCFRLVNRVPLRARTGPPTAADWERIHRIEAAIVEGVGAYPFGSSCVHRSITLVLFLRVLLRVDARVHVGVRKYPFGAHAWAECYGRVLGDTAENAGRFKRLSL